MLSKCLNPRCAEKFRYLGQGQLYRIDYLEVRRRHAFLDGEAWDASSSRREGIEYFWLCEHCSATLTIASGEDGEVRLIARGGIARAAAAADDSSPCDLLADAS
jgi:hypothetical protein